MSANPLRLAALVQGYPVRPPFSVSAAGTLKLWLDVSSQGSLLDANGNATSSNSPAKISDLSGVNAAFFLDDCIPQSNAKNGLRALNVGVGQISNSPPSSGAASWEFLHNGEWHGFWVIKTPVKPLSGSERVLSLIDTNGLGDTSRRGAWLRVVHSAAYTNPRVSLTVTRGVLNTRVIDYATPQTASGGTFVLCHVAVDTAAAAADRVSITIAGSDHSGNTASSTAAAGSPSSAWRLVGSSTSSSLMSLGEMAIFSGSMTAANIAAVKTYLKDKWAVL